MSPTRIERRTLIAGVLVAVVIIAVALSAAIASAEESATVISAPAVTPGTPGVSTVATVGAYPSAPATGTVSAKGGYALDFTLPTFGKAGCLVCHGDKNLVLAKGDSTKSFWIDESAYAMSAHKDVVCTGCHLDFGYSSPHNSAVKGDWAAVAKQACKNCHQDQYDLWARSAHSPSPTGGQADPKAANKPLCGDCHGSHFMPVLKKNPAGKAQLRAGAQEMCGRDGCHAEQWANFNDYYHGAAFKTGADDAPSCWTCHGTHDIQKASERTAPMNSANFGAKNSCGTKGCHQGAGPEYASYAPMIHGRDKIVSENPIVRFLAVLFNRK